MSDEPKNSGFQAIRRPLLLAVSGVVTMAVGVSAGLWLQQENDSSDEGNHSDLNETLQVAQTDLTGDEIINDESSLELFDTDQNIDSEPSRQTESKSAPPLIADATPIADLTGTSVDAVPDDTMSLANHIAIADEELRIGNYSKALDIYRYALSQVEGSAEAAVRFRMALCAEAAGNSEEARVRYQFVSQKFIHSPWAGVSQLGEARCLSAMGRIDQLESTVLRYLLLDETHYSSTIRGELFHIAGLAFCRQLLSSSKDDLLADDGLVVSTFMPDPILVLDNLPVMLAEHVPKQFQTTFEILQSTDKSADSVYIKVHCAQSPVSSLLQAITTRSGFECELSPAAKDALNGRRQAVHSEDVSLSVLLDGLTIPFGLTWTQDDKAIRFNVQLEQERSTSGEFRLAAAERLLRNALFQAPDSDQSGHSRVALGTLLFKRSRHADAAYIFKSQIDQFPRSEVDAEAAFNLAKARMVLGQSDEALNDFLHVVDSSGGQPVARMAAYIYVGRLQLENEAYQPAVSALVRAVLLSESSPLAKDSALMLSSAYLLAGNPQGANSVLMNRREILNEETTRDTAAFLSAFCRFRSAVLDDRKEREGRSLVTALTRFEPQSQFGLHWNLLAAEACEELGLYQQATQHYLNVVKSNSGAQLRNRALLQLASRYRTDNRLQEASHLLTSIDADQADTFSEHVALQAAHVAIQRGESDSAVQLCHHVVTQSEDEEVRRAALKAMGQAFEQKQDHRSAVYCFSGRLPNIDLPKLETTPEERTPLAQEPTGKEDVK